MIAAIQDAKETGAESMAWHLRSSVVLMTVYVAVFAFAGPWLATGTTSHRNLAELVIAAALAMCAAHGSRAARALMITYGALGILATIFGSTHWWSPPLPRLLNMAYYMLQIALLVSTPMYQRTRPGWAPGGSRPTALLPSPPIWTLLVSASAGLVITLLQIGNLRAIPCPAHVKVLAHTPCLAGGTGYPIAYRWFSGYIQLYGDNDKVRWLNVAAPRGLQVAAFATDWALWSLGIVLALYLIWLNHSREYANPPQQYGEPSPARP